MSETTNTNNLTSTEDISTLKKDDLTNKEEINDASNSLHAQIEIARINYESGLQIVKMLFLAHGGAIVALLAFFSNVWNKGLNQSVLQLFASSMYSFGYGIFFTVMCTFFAYMTNILQSFSLSNKKIIIPILAMFLFGALSVIAFVVGLNQSYNAIKLQFS
ncbi:hypothetical protein [Providencia sp. PROV236]|uniref:hypothetical protein n=1 Tax=Providencia sp. PROV236 TaxID=2936798 RepID=UPI0034E1B3FD